MEKTINIDGQNVIFKASAATPRVYRQAFGRDIYIDLTKLYEDMSSGQDLSIESLETFENVAFCMHSQAEGKILKRESVEEEMSLWLDEFSTFSIYKIIPELMDLWKITNEQTAKPKNQAAPQSDQ